MGEKDNRNRSPVKHVKIYSEEAAAVFSKLGFRVELSGVERCFIVYYRPIW